MRYILEKVVSEGSGKNAYLPGFHIGGKTATSEKLPRSLKKYISSFIGMAPADNPKIIGIVIIDEPVGIYYGGTIAAPVMKEIYENVLPYLGIEESYAQEEQSGEELVMPSLEGKTIKEAKSLLTDHSFSLRLLGEGEYVIEQFPMAGQEVSDSSTVILYLGEGAGTP